MLDQEKVTRKGKVLWVERDVLSTKKKEGKELLEKFSIYDPKFPQNLNEIKGGPATIVEGEGFRIDLSKRERKPMGFWHRNLDDDELIFIVRGRARWYTELGTFEMKEGDILIIPKGISHRVEPLEEGTYVALEIKSKYIKRVQV